MNRVSLRGRLRDGTYRLIMRPRGASGDVADVTVVIANGKLRRARTAAVCRPAETGGSGSTSGGAIAGGGGRSSGGESSGGGVEAVLKKGKQPIVAATGAVARKVAQIPDPIEAAADDPFSDPFVLIVIGLLTLSSAGLGLLLLAQVLRTMQADRAR